MYNPCDCSRPVSLKFLGYFGTDGQTREAYRFSTVQNEMLAGMSYFDLQYVTHFETEGGFGGAISNSLQLSGFK
jgi:hypothetical protein